MLVTVDVYTPWLSGVMMPIDPIDINCTTLLCYDVTSIESHALLARCDQYMSGKEHNRKSMKVATWLSCFGAVKPGATYSPR